MAARVQSAVTEMWRKIELDPSLSNQWFYQWSELLNPLITDVCKRYDMDRNLLKRGFLRSALNEVHSSATRRNGRKTLICIRRRCVKKMGCPPNRTGICSNPSRSASESNRHDGEEGARARCNRTLVPMLHRQILLQYRLQAHGKVQQDKRKGQSRRLRRRCGSLFPANGDR